MLTLAVAAFLLAFGNLSLFGDILHTYPLDANTAPALLSLVIFCGAITALLLGVLSIGRAAKPVLILALLVSAPAAYLMDNYGVVINDEMWQNVAQTNAAEATDLLNLELLANLLLLGRDQFSSTRSQSAAKFFQLEQHGGPTSTG